MNCFAVTLPMPPSTNNMFATVLVKGKPRRIISREYKAWRLDASGEIFTAWTAQGKPAFGPHLLLTIHIGLDYRGDISNRIKAIEDSLGESIPDFPDDRYIERIEIERVPGINGAHVHVMQCAKPKALDEARPIGEIIKPIVARIVEGI